MFLSEICKLDFLVQTNQQVLVVLKRFRLRTPQENPSSVDPSSVHYGPNELLVVDVPVAVLVSG